MQANNEFESMGIMAEMHGYLVKIAMERGYKTEAEISDNLGDMMREAVKRMDKIVTEFVEQKTWRAKNVRADMADGIWLYAQAEKVMERQSARISSY